MGNVTGTMLYGEHLNCYENKDQCSKACGTFECLYVDKCGDSSAHHYVCIPFDTAFIMWLLVGIFVVVVLCCSTIVVCYAIRAIKASFRNTVSTDHDIVFYNARNVHSFPHPGTVWGRPPPAPEPAANGKKKANGSGAKRGAKDNHHHPHHFP